VEITNEYLFIFQIPVGTVTLFAAGKRGIIQKIGEQ
jgi:hypothetical protein